MWLIDPEVFALMQKAIEAGFNPTSEQIINFESRMAKNNADGSPGILSIVGETAEINIEGPLTSKLSFLAMLFCDANTTYKEIILAFEKADSMPEVKSITMSVDSPGGQVDGLFDALAAIESVKKPITAMIYNRAASAAYAIVSQADKIIANNRAVSVGSIGIVVSFSNYINSQEINITSDKSPNKRPDEKTTAGKKIIKAELNTLYDLFVESIANGRNITTQKVNSDFGKGSMIYADDAIKAGMIDEITGVEPKTVNKTTKTALSSPIKFAARSGKNQKKGEHMDLETLKAEHPEVFSAAVNIGIEKERDRVNAHIIMGMQSGDTKTAFEAIKKGDEMTATLQATYMTAAMNNANVKNRQADSDDADTGKPFVPGTEANVDSEKVLAAVMEKTGFKEAK